uniref:tripartite motif-containing protein 16-like n=1 Tax=Epinephelus lanceolatus TaxID=310571 RepID=UPI0014478EB5
LIRLIEKRRSDVKQHIRSQQKTKVRQVKELQEKLQQEITDLRRKDTELEKLSHTEDHNQFLQSYPSLSHLTDSEDSSRINIRPVRHFEDVTAAVSEARDKLQDFVSDVWTKISLTKTEVNVLLAQPQPKTRAEFLQYSRQITLDPNTAGSSLELSEGNTRATVTPFHLKKQSSQSNVYSRQVLSRESLTGRCYWEVKWSGPRVSVAVTSAHMREPVYETRFGNNDTSWAVYCLDGFYEFRHNSISTSISGPQSSRVGVYLDHPAGILSFYRVSDTMTLLHRVQTTFTQPLYAGLGVYSYNHTAELCDLK